MANSLFAELKRRNVFRVMAAYVVMSWLILQVVDLLADILNLPDVFAQSVLVLLGIGFVVALTISWIYQLTPDGLKRETPDGEESAEVRAISHKLNYATIIMVVLGVLFVTFENVIFERPASSNNTTASSKNQTTSQQNDVINRSIAVLPFVNMSSDKENEYFADGLSEEILNQLAQIASLKVTGRTSSFSYKGKNEDLRVIGETLGVANILEGSVRRNGDMVRVTAQLIRANDGFHLWSHTYDDTLEDIFAVQDDISKNVARALKIILDNNAIEKMQNAGIRNVDAFIAYQKANELFNLAHGAAPLMETLSEGLVYYNQALEIVPEFASAHADVTDYYAHLMMHTNASFEEKNEAMEKIKYHYDTAYKYSSDPAKKSAFKFDRIMFSDDWSSLMTQAKQVFATSKCKLPNWTESLIPFGYAQEVQSMWLRYKECEPLSITQPIQTAMTLLWLEKPQEALDVLLESEQKVGSNPWFAAYKQYAYLGIGDDQQALSLADDVMQDEAFGMTAYVMPYAFMGKFELAKQAREDWLEHRNDINNDMILNSFAILGQRDLVNSIAARIDSDPGGPLKLLVYTTACMCGAPFDIDATPNLKKRLTEAGLSWPPKTTVFKFPIKDW